MRALLQPILDDAIARHVTPGAVILVSDRGRIACHEAFGASADAKHQGVSVQRDTIYDAASLTKAAVTSCLLMTLVDEGKISLSSKVYSILPSLRGPGKDAITLCHLMGHASGLPAHVHYYDRIWSGDYAGAANPRDALVTMAGAEVLSYASGTQSVYSDLGYILLGRLIEVLCGTSLETAFAERIATPLAMVDSQFVNLQSEAIHPKLSRVAPSQFYPSRGLLRGQVHDDNAHAGGGVCGHAGLFTTSADLARLAQALLDAYAGKSSLFAGPVVREFWSRKAAPSSSWRMGWDTPSTVPGVSHTGDHWPASSVGHLGFTGTAMWLAPEQDRFVIMLSNRVYYAWQKDYIWEKSGIKSLRRAVFDAIARALPAL